MLNSKLSACFLTACAIALSAAPSVACELGHKAKGASHTMQDVLSHHTLTVQMKDASLSNVLAVMSKKGGFKVQYAKGVSKDIPVTVNLNNVDLSTALKSLLASKGLVGTWDGATLRVKKDPKVAATQI